MNQLTEPWRQFIPAIAVVMNKAERVRWDRCIDGGGGILRLYGWVDRPDDHADFVVLDFQRYTDVRILDCAFFTSSADAELATELAAAIEIEVDDHIPCQRIEEVFGGMVTNAIKLEGGER